MSAHSWGGGGGGGLLMLCERERKKKVTRLKPAIRQEMLSYYTVIIPVTEGVCR